MTNAPARVSRRRQIVHTGLGMAVLQACTFVASLVIARGLGAAGQARFQALISCCMVAVLLGKVGLDEGLAYTIPRVEPRDRVRSVIAYALGFALVAGLALGAGIAALSSVIADSVFSIAGLGEDLSLAVALTPVLLVLFTGLGALRGLARSDLRAYAYYYVVGPAFLGLVLVLSAGGLTQADAYIARIASFGVGAVSCVVMLGANLRGGPWRPSRRDVRALHACAGWMMLIGVFQYMVEQPIVDLIILGHHVTDADVGAYSVAAKIAGVLGLIPAAFIVVMAPYFVRHSVERDEAGREASYSRMSFYVAHVSVVACAGLFFLSGEVLELLGEEYLVATPWLRALLPGYLIAGLLGLNTPVLLAAGLARVELVMIVVATAVMVALGLALVPELGALGMAIATGAAVAILASLRRIACRRVAAAKLWWSVRELVGAAIAFGVGLALRELDDGLFGACLAIAGFLATYTGVARLRVSPGDKMEP